MWDGGRQGERSGGAGGGAAGVRSRAHVGVMYVCETPREAVPARSEFRCVGAEETPPVESLLVCLLGLKLPIKALVCRFICNPAPSLFPPPSPGERGTSGRRLAAG